jgi:hypothetical protein
MTTYFEGWRVEGFAVDDAEVGGGGLKLKDRGKGKGRGFREVMMVDVRV